MDIVLGASGQVGSMVVKNLHAMQRPVKAVIRDPSKARALKDEGIRVAIADMKDEEALCAALKEGENLFVLTPENPKDQDILLGVQEILQNVREAAKSAGIRKIVALSSMGAQHPRGTGTLQMSFELEHSFEDLGMNLVFVRPAYYFSNWLASADEVLQTGTLKTFFPPDLQIPMVAPADVAACVARLMTENCEGRMVCEIQGPFTYSSREVGEAFAAVLGRDVRVEQIPRAQWEEVLGSFGMSESALWNFVEMTEAVIDGRVAEGAGPVCSLQGETTLEEFLLEAFPEEKTPPLRAGESRPALL